LFSHDYFQGVVFLLPGFFYLIVLALYPLGYSMVLSFSAWDVRDPDSVIRIQGFFNYLKVLRDPQFLSSLWLTVKFLILALAIEIPVGLGLAMLLTYDRLNRTVVSLFRAAIVMTLVMVPTVSGILWRTMLTNRYGPLNYVLTLIGLPDIPWLSDADLAFYALIIVEVWQYTSVVTLIFVGGLMGIPKDQVESARIDGCSGIQVFWHVILPFLRPIFAIVLLLRSMDLLKRFDFIYAMTGGGPGYATEVANLYIHRKGIRYFEFTEAAAASWILLLILLPLTLFLIIKIFMPREE
jgi:multiple sugar transport system permease protein